MAANAIVAVLSALCCCQMTLGSEQHGGLVSLVQNAVRVHGAADWRSAKGDFLVDNSELQHKGPGLLFRASKNLSDIAGRSEYAPWGAVISGTPTPDGWFQHEKYYLPMRVHGVSVIKAAEEPTKSDEPEVAELVERTASRPVQKKVHWKYLATTVQMKDGSEMPCAIHGPGAKANTFDIEVRPKMFSPYNMTVPAEALKEVQYDKQGWKSAAAKANKSSIKPGWWKSAAEKANNSSVPTPKPRSRLEAAKTAKEAKAAKYISLKVVDIEGKELMEFSMLRRSPLRTLMKMACQKSQLSWFKCSKTMQWARHHHPVHEEDSVGELGLEDGDSITMFK
uniref:Ubiquitin-like domain-containing protein n=1 Tax=Alexandrium catenella TaxID=2925 RepID=A0A7S1MAB8_ALECA